MPWGRSGRAPLSAFATTLGILRAECVPVFTDVDASGLLDLDRCEEIIKRGRTRFLLPVHLYGNSLDLDRLVEMRVRHDLVVVEDCAQAIGASSGGYRAGTAGDAAASSLYRVARSRLESGDSA